MNDTVGEFERLLGHAALKLWPTCPEMCRNYCSRQRFPSILQFETG